MKIMVIGNDGQLGREFGYQGIDFPEIDIADKKSCRDVLNRYKPDVIINCAAYTAVDACESDPVCEAVNAKGPGYLAEWATENGAFLVHISTDYVFSGDKPLFQVYTETDIPNPVSAYGRTKFAGEQAVFNSGADTAVLRTAWLYGVHGKNFLKTMLRLAVQNPEREIRVVNDQFGSPTWARTLAEQISIVIERRQTGLFHATSEEFCSWFDLASAFLQLMDVPHRISPCTTAEYPTSARRPINSILENTALENAGINRFTDWKNDLEKFVQTHREELLVESRGR